MLVDDPFDVVDVVEKGKAPSEAQDLLSRLGPWGEGPAGCSRLSYVEKSELCSPDPSRPDAPECCTGPPDVGLVGIENPCFSRICLTNACLSKGSGSMLIRSICARVGSIGVELVPRWSSDASY